MEVLCRFEDDCLCADGGFERIREGEWIAQGATHLEYDFSLLHGQVNHHDCIAVGAGAVVFGDGIDFVHQLYGALVVIEQGEVDVKHVTWAVCFMSVARRGRRHGRSGRLWLLRGAWCSFDDVAP